MPDEPILWKDRKRILGLPISFTRYELTATRLTIRKGLFSTTTDETRLYRVLDTSLTRTLGQKSSVSGRSNSTARIAPTRNTFL